MQKEYELLKKYSKMMTEQEYPVGDAAQLMIETENGVFSTKPGADLADLKEDEVEKLAMDHLPAYESGMNAMVYSQTPYCQQALRDMRTFKPSLDDMAQIIGPAAVIADGRAGSKNAEKSLGKALKKNDGCFLLKGLDRGDKGRGYTVTVGRSLYEAVVAMTVLEKSAEITFLADRIGGAKNINGLETRLMHAIYKKKYSKSESAAKKEESIQGVAEAKQAEEALSGEKSTEQILREKLVEYGIKLVKSGLVQGTWGNISIRLDEQYMLVTPSGLDYMRLTPADMVKVDINTLEYEGNIKPTSEKGLHAEIYKKRADIGGVIHTHSKYCSVFAAAEKNMPVSGDMKDIFGNEIRLAAYALPGTKNLKTNTVAALGDNFGCIMSHHGMIACGKDIETAFDNCAMMEECGKAALGEK